MLCPAIDARFSTATIWPFSKIIHDWWWWLDAINKHFGNPSQFKWIESGDLRKNKFITSDFLHMCSMCLPGAAETPSNAVADWLMPSRRPISGALANRLEKRLGTVKNTSPIILISGKIPTHAFSWIQDKINGIPDYFPVRNHRWQFPTFSRNPDKHGTLLTAKTVHYSVVIMRVMASQITCVSIVCWIVYSGTNQRKHQTST